MDELIEAIRFNLELDKVDYEKRDDIALYFTGIKGTDMIRMKLTNEILFINNGISWERVKGIKFSSL